MKVTKHIAFFYNESRFQYLNKTLEETNNYDYITDIFIHTNKDFSNDKLYKYENGSLNIVTHDLSNRHPYDLPKLTRSLMKYQRDLYDIFIYVEDDILIPNNSLQYWVHHKDILLKHNYNLGFIRIEFDNQNKEYCTDICHSPDMSNLGFLTKEVIIESQKYIINDKNPYCGFWIYDKLEFNKFVDSKYYDIRNVNGYDIRAVVAIGLHGVHTDWYKNTVIPLKENKLVKRSSLLT